MTADKGCDAVRNALLLDLYGEASPSQRRLAHAHLQDCPACRERRASFAALRPALDALPVPAPAHDLVARCAARARTIARAAHPSLFDRALGELRATFEDRGAWIAAGLAVVAAALVALEPGPASRLPVVAPLPTMALAPLPAADEPGLDRLDDDARRLQQALADLRDATAPPLEDPGDDDGLNVRLDDLQTGIRALDGELERL